jgi:hypothetical protein
MTEEVLQGVEAFRRRPLPEEMASVYLDGLHLKLLRGEAGPGLRAPAGGERLGVRWSLGQVRARTLLAEDLRRVYGTESRGEALRALEALREAWGARYPGVVALWAGDSGAFLRFYGYPKALWPYLRSTNLMERFIREIRRGTKVRGQAEGLSCPQVSQRGGGVQAPVPRVVEASCFAKRTSCREVGGEAASRSEHLAAQGILGGEGGAGEGASGAVCPPYTNAYTYFLTRPDSPE